MDGRGESADEPDDAADPGGAQALPTTEPAAQDGAGNVEQIRDILFGRQMRDYEHRFRNLEDAFREEVTGLRADLDRRLEALEQHLKEALGTLGAALDREARDRSGDVRRLGADLEKGLGDARERLSGLEADLDGRASELREQLHARSASLEQDARTREERLGAELAAVAAELRHAKVDRSALARLIADVAAHISDPADQGPSG